MLVVTGAVVYGQFVTVGAQLEIVMIDVVMTVDVVSPAPVVVEVAAEVVELP